MPLTMQIRRLHRPLDAVALTVSGNEMADTFGVSRSANTQGDGRTFPDKSVGIWPAATNRIDNGNATTNTTGITDVSCTTSRATTGTVIFGTTAFSVATSNLVANEGPYQAVDGGLASTQYTCSAWAWAPSGSPTVRIVLEDSVSGKQASAAVTLTATPQRISVTATTGALSINIRSYVETNVQQNVTFRIGGWQVETGAVATPYVETNGGTATRAAARVRLPATGYVDTRNLLNSTQSWIAVCMEHDRVSSAVTVNFRWFTWLIDGNEYIINDYNGNETSTGNRLTGGVGAGVGGLATTWAAGGTVVCLTGWTATLFAMAINGAAPTTASNTSIPVLSTTAFDIGSQLGSAIHLGARVRWAAAGTGAANAALSAYLNMIRLGGGVPDLYECPGNATLVYDGRNAVAQVRG